MKGFTLLAQFLITSMTIVAIIIFYAVITIMIDNKKTGKYATINLEYYQPESYGLYHFFMTVLLRPLMILFANGKITHWYDWVNIDTSFNGIITHTIRHDPKAPNYKDSPFNRMKASLFAWKKCVVFTLSRPTNDVWYIGFKIDDHKVRLCKIALLDDKVKMLVGPINVEFCAFDKRLRPIPLQKIALTDRSDKTWKNIPLL